MPRRTAALVLVVYGVIFTLLAVGSGVERSATVDEPTHLVAGYTALTAGDYRLDTTHPPLVRLWAALPLLVFERPAAPTAAIDRAPARTWLASSGPGDVAREFLYSRVDADGWLNASRMMIVVLALGAGILVFLWASEWLGVRAAVVALACYTLSPDMLAHAALVTTDIGITVFIFAATYLLWRTCRRPTWANVIGLSGCVAAAVLTKFSGVLLLPLVIVLLSFAVWRRAGVTTARGLAIALLVAVTTFTAIWSVYGWRYAPSPSTGWLFDVRADAAAHAAVPLAGLASWIDTHRLLPNAFTQGLLSCAIGSVQPAYLLGRVSPHGWWYYIPVAFLVKTPIPLIALLTIGLIVYVTERRRLGVINEAFVVLPVGVYLGSAMASGINIGVRHILPIYPFLFLIAGAAADRLIGARHRLGRIAVIGLLAVWVLSVGRAYPHTLSFFNVAAGGPGNGLTYLADSNLDWGQHLKRLKAWMDDRDVPHINLAYFGQADPRHYRINCTYLPATFAFAPQVGRPPVLPGYVAISATVLSGVYLDPSWRVFYSGFRHRTPLAEIGHTIRIYWVDQWPDPDQDGADRLGAGPDAEAALANRLLFSLRWPRLAAVHYRHYLQQRPSDAVALADYGTALEVSGDVRGGIEALRRAVALSPRDASLRVSLGVALLADRDPAQAEDQATQAIALQPTDPSAFTLLGRACMLQGRIGEAVAAFQRALTFDPTYGPARADLDRVRQLLRDRDAPMDIRIPKPGREL